MFLEVLEADSLLKKHESKAIPWASKYLMTRCLGMWLLGPNTSSPGVWMSRDFLKQQKTSKNKHPANSCFCSRFLVIWNLKNHWHTGIFWIPTLKSVSWGFFCWSLKIIWTLETDWRHFEDLTGSNPSIGGSKILRGDSNPSIWWLKVMIFYPLERWERNLPKKKDVKDTVRRDFFWS